MSKKLCKVRKKSDEGSVKKIAKSPKYKCKKCKGVAQSKKSLCKPKEI